MRRLVDVIVQEMEIYCIVICIVNDVICIVNDVICIVNDVICIVKDLCLYLSARKHLPTYLQLPYHTHSLLIPRIDQAPSYVLVITPH